MRTGVTVLELHTKLHVTDLQPPGLPTPCWSWAGSHDRHGYARVKWRGRNEYVRRLVCSNAGHPLRSTDHVVALCRNPGCVNLDHLVIGTEADARAFGRRGRFYLGDICFARQMIKAKIASVRAIATGWGLSDRFLAGAVRKCQDFSEQPLAANASERREIAMLYLTPSPIVPRWNALKASLRTLART